MLSFNLLDVFLLVGIIQGLFLAFSLQRVKNTNKSTNRVLASLLVMASLMLIGRLVYFRYPVNWPLQLSLLPDVIIFVFGPLSYKFVRRLCFAGERSYRLSWLHFIPAILQFGVFLFFLQYTGAEYITFWNDGTLLIPFAIIEGAAIALNLLYWYMSLRLLLLYEKEEQNVISYSQGVKIFVRFFLFSLLLFFCVWLFSYVRTYLVEVSGTFVNYNAVWIIIPMFIYIITYFTIRQPEFFRLSLDTIKSTDNGTRLNEKEVQRLNERLDRLFQIEKIHLNPGLTLGELADKLQSSKHDVSWLLNNIHNSSFYDFVNRHRVEEFLTRVERGAAEHLTFLGIAFEVGFKSKSTFNKSFKISTGQTPTGYINKLKNSAVKA